MRELWRSWRDDDLVVDAGRGVFARAEGGRFEHHGPQFDIAGRFNVPRSPQVDPVLLQAGDSSDGRQLGAAIADGIFTPHRPLEQARAFSADLKGRAAALGRDPDHLKILPGTAVVVADTDSDAQELARHIQRQQVSGATAIATLERLWNRDLSAYDPDGPLPDVEPDTTSQSLSQGRANLNQDRLEDGAASGGRRPAPRDGRSVSSSWRSAPARRSSAARRQSPSR